VVVVGGANLDYVVQGEQLPKPGETSEGRHFQLAEGGKGANQAVAVARLGGKVAFVGCIGNDEAGRILRGSLRRARIDIAHLRIDKFAPTGVALIMVDARAEKMIMSAPGANLAVTLTQIAKAAPLISQSKVLLLQLEIPMPCIAKAIQIAKAAGVPVVLDPAPARPISSRLLRQVDVLRPNASEAAALTDAEVKDTGSARRAAYKLMKSGVRVAVVVQAGKAGNLLVTREGHELLARHIKVKSVDSTGAGDAFIAALAVGIARKWKWDKSLAFANAAAALATTKLGAQPSMPLEKDVLQLISRSPPPTQWF
jgi:ribokinase